MEIHTFTHAVSNDDFKTLKIPLIIGKSNLQNARFHHEFDDLDRSGKLKSSI